MLPPLIALTGPAECGKSTIANALTDLIATGDHNHGMIGISFAGPLKGMARSLLKSAGYPGDEVGRLLHTSRGKRALIPELGGITVRRLLQTLGTEWGRTHLGSYVWADLAMATAQTMREGGDAVVIDDLRFVEEADHVRRCGGVVIELYRPELEPEQPVHGMVVHASEAGVPDELIHAVVYNQGTPAQVAERILAQVTLVRFGDSDARRHEWLMHRRFGYVPTMMPKT